MKTVSSFFKVGGASYRYTFLFVVWNTYEDDVRSELAKQAEAFAGDLGGTGLFAQAFPQRITETADEVRDKHWPEEIGRRFEDESDPVLLVLDHDFADFDPREHGYALIWLSEYHGNAQEIRSLLQTLARMTRTGQDVIQYLLEAAERAERAARLREAKGSVGVAARLASYVEIKPQLFGVSIDLKAILRDIHERH